MDRYNSLCPLVYGKLKSKRRKKRLQKLDLEKKLIALQKEQRQLWQARRQLEPVPLEKPIRKGWKRYFVLREDLRNRPEAPFFQTLLNKINTVEHSKDKKFTAKKRKKRYQYVLRTQKLRPVFEYEFTHPRHTIFTEKEREYFVPGYFQDRQGKYTRVYLFIQPWRYVLTIQPHWITHTRNWDEELETRLSEIRRYLEKNNLTHKMDKLTRGWVYNGTKSETENLHRNKPFTQFLEIYQEEQEFLAQQGHHKTHRHETDYT